METLTTSPLVGAALIGLLAMLSVALWTVRVALTAAGRRVAASCVSAVEALTFVFSFASVSEQLDSPPRVAAYVMGVAAGTFVGLLAHDRVAHPAPCTRRSLRRANASGRPRHHLPDVAGCPVTPLREPLAPRVPQRS